VTAVEYLKQQYIERGETLPSGVFQEALEMEQKQMKEMYLKGIENYDPTFKRKSTWTTSKKDKAFIKS
jgi:flagellar biosynthesis component FlhA